ncbi:MAG: SIMPL domain-containing protein [Anaerolineales bacterium]|nr:SIMPL domain-containing protein [Anaerolineales bacterium]
MFKNSYKTILAVLMLVGITAVLIACNPIAATPAAAQSASNANGGITVVGQGEAYDTPDQAQVQVGVEIFAPTVAEATSQNEATIQQIMDALNAMDIASEDVQTTNYSLWAEQIYGDKGPEGIAGYRVTNQVNVTIRDIDQVSDVLSAVIDAGANTIYGIQFSVADPAELEAEARAAAMADARARAESLAELAGVDLGSITMISEVINQPVMPMGYGGGMAVAEVAAGPSVSPGQLNYNVQVQVTFAIQ